MKVVRILLFAGIAYLLFVIVSEVRGIINAERPDSARIILLFGALVLTGLALGVMVALVVVPALSEKIGNFFFLPDTRIEKGPHADALAKVAQGDFEGAIEEYNLAFKKDRADMLALSEIVHLYCDKLDDHAAGAEFLEHALGQEWPAEQGAFLAARLADIYWHHQGDARRARELLVQIAEARPETQHAANAMHRLREIEQALATRSITDLPAAPEPEPAAAPPDGEMAPAEQPENAVEHSGEQNDRG